MEENKKFFKKIKHIGLAVFLLAIVALVVVSYDSYVTAIKGHEQCSLVNEVGYCTVIGHVPYEAFLGIISLITVMIAGLYIFYHSRNIYFDTSQKIEAVSANISNLSDEEKKIYEIIKIKEGAAFQSDIIKETNFSKVKVSRIIDRLEAKSIVERRRRGMSNMIVLK